MANPEQHSSNAERTAEVERAAAERAAELHEKTQEYSETLESHEHTVQEARAEATREAKKTEEYHPAAETEKAAQPTTHVGAKTREKSYRQTMHGIQKEMSTPERVFSKVIHNKVVEKTSDAVGTTIARPDAILTGSLFAFVFVFAVYLVAKYNGFSLQGSETIIAFIAGWIIGLIVDFIRTILRRH